MLCVCVCVWCSVLMAPTVIAFFFFTASNWKARGSKVKGTNATLMCTVRQQGDEDEQDDDGGRRRRTWVGSGGGGGAYA